MLTTRYTRGRLTMDGADLARIAEKSGTPA